MATSFNRRQVLKKSALFMGGLTFFPQVFSSLYARIPSGSFYRKGGSFLSEHKAMETTPPELAARLLANENPFGPSEKAKKAIADAVDLSYQYPFRIASRLEEKIAGYEGIKKEQLLLSSGSSPLLLAAAMLFSKGTIVSATPSYEDLLESAEDQGGKVIRVPLTPDYIVDLDAMEKVIDSNTSLVYICNPNNPTATVLETAKLKAFCERVSKKTTVFVDEAYIDYLDNPQAASMIGGIKNGQNIIVARTFSKLYGFAGLRVGYVVAQPEMIEKLKRYTSGPWSIAATSLGAAVAAYQEQDFLQSALKKTAASKAFLYETLKSEGYQYIPSSANFVLFPIKMDGRRFAEEMMKRDVGIRTWKFGGKDWCRVSIGKMDEMQAFAKAFKELS